MFHNELVIVRGECVWIKCHLDLDLFLDLVCALLQHKCEQYWPDKEGGNMYGDIHVEKVETEQYADFTIRIFTLTKVSSRVCVLA